MGPRNLFVLAAAVALFLPGKAAASIVLSPCKSGGVECGTVNVPVDRSGALGGTIPLHVEVLPANGTVRGVMFLIAGGPGQGSAQSFDLKPGFNRDLMRYMFPGYTLVAFDNRGTGDSAVIDCPGLQKSVQATVEEEAALAAECAAIIGPQRVFYATRDHAEDMEAVRAALGVDRIGLFGVSYGTKLAQAYALAHPDHVDRIVLDSVVPARYPDPFELNVLREMPATLSAFCNGGFCRRATPNFAAEVVKLANRLEAQPLRGKIVAANGKLKTVHMNGEELISTILDADLSPGLAAEAPAAVHAALAGVSRPLLRLFDLDLRSNQFTPKELSFGLYAATNCADEQFPWAPSTPPAGRAAAINSALAALAPTAFGGFGSWAARTGDAYFCAQWPSPAGRTPLGPGPLPNVPALVLDGGFDLRTPVANAVSVVDQFPKGQLIVVPGVGHDVTGADFSGCAWNAVRSWILGTLSAPSRAMCPRVAPLIKVVGAFPSRPSRSASATLTAVGKTLRDAEATWFQLSSGGVARGLYGGKLADLKKAAGFTLARYSLAPGVLLSGKITLVGLRPPSTYRGTVRVSGPAAVAGTVKISANGTIAGTLGGRHVKGKY